MKPVILKIAFFLVSALSYSNAFTQTQQELENIITFSRLYGYVKYFHPSDEAASIDWDRLAIYGCQQVSQCKNSVELQKTLTDIFKPIAPTIQLFPEKANESFNKSAVMLINFRDYKAIAWQHSGVGLGGKGDIYQSARMNRPVTTVTTSASQFLPVSTWIDATPIQGKEFVFHGRMRMLSGDGQAQLWARVDRDNKSMGFFDNMGDRPVRNKEWASYEIKGKIDTDGSKLLIGVMLIGSGEMEFDDLVLEVKEGNEWKVIYSNSFAEDEKGKAPKSLNFNNAMLGTYAIAVQKGTNENESFVSIRSLVSAADSKDYKPRFTQYPQVGEYLEKKIGGGLKLILPLALYGTATQTFPIADTVALKGLKKKLAAISSEEMTGNNLFTRLGDLTIAWNVFQHFYPYFDVVKTDWNNALKEAVEHAYKDQNADDFQKTLQLMTAQLKDGHVWVGARGQKKVFMPLIQWEWIEGELVITNVADTSIALTKGDIVKRIDNRDAKGYFAAVYPKISAATKGWLEYRAQTESLMGEKGSEMKLDIVRSDNTTATVSVIRKANQAQYNTARPKEDSIKVLPNGMMYINIDVASMEMIKNALPELKKSKTIICDLRGYPNGNHEFIQYLLTGKDTSSQWMQIPQIIYPDRERIAGWQKEKWGMMPTKPHLDARIIFLTDGQAISYAESYMGFIENYKLATIVGQPTAGTNGNVNPFNLPGGYSISWTGMKVLKHDGSTHHGVGILPNVYVEKTIKGVREGRDEFLEKAVEVGGMAEGKKAF